MKKFGRFLKEYWLSLITLAPAICLSLYSLFVPDDKMSGRALSMAIALIAGFFFAIIKHLDKIQNAIQQIKKGASKGVLLTKPNDSITGNQIAEAKEELFIGGWSLSRFIAQDEALYALPNTVHIRLLVMDVEDETVCNNCKTIYGRFPRLMSLKHLEDFSSKNLEIRVLKFPPPLVVIARDMCTSKGYIQIIYRYFGEFGVRSPCVHLTPNDADWYDFYKNQIELLWEQGTPWQP